MQEKERETQAEMTNRMETETMCQNETNKQSVQAGREEEKTHTNSQGITTEKKENNQKTIFFFCFLFFLFFFCEGLQRTDEMQWRNTEIRQGNEITLGERE